MKQIECTKQNCMVLSEAIAGKIEACMNERKNYAQDLLDSCDTKIKYR